jgi:ferredoxin
MGHLIGKDIYRRLGKKIDGLSVRTPWNNTFYEILKELYSPPDAELIVRMPYSLSTLAAIEQATGMERAHLVQRLESLCDRGLIMDIRVRGQYYYAPSPMMLGIFEFTMMRTGGVDYKKVARLFYDYFEEGTYQAKNFGAGQRWALSRVVPHDNTVRTEEYVEVLDYEKAAALIAASSRFGMGVCGCRHEKHHLGRACAAPLDNCSSFEGPLVDFLVRRGLAREVSKSEMLENVARSRELGLVLTVDNVQRNINCLCHCCPCCCHVLQGITKHGYPNSVVSSNFIAVADPAACNGCGVCARACPVEAISLVTNADPRFHQRLRPQVDESICLGCGVCAVKCRSGAMSLRARSQRVIHPETTFERTILQCLEQGTLQNQLFDDPGKLSQSILRGLLGGFLRLPMVKQALMSKTLRSRFFEVLRKGMVQRGKGPLTEI